MFLFVDLFAGRCYYYYYYLLGDVRHIDDNLPLKVSDVLEELLESCGF